MNILYKYNAATLNKCRLASYACDKAIAEAVEGVNDAIALGILVDIACKKVARDNPSLCGIEPGFLTHDDCDALGLERSDDMPQLRLVPTWMAPFLVDGVGDEFLPMK